MCVFLYCVLCISRSLVRRIPTKWLNKRIKKPPVCEAAKVHKGLYSHRQLTDDNFIFYLLSCFSLQIYRSLPTFRRDLKAKATDFSETLANTYMTRPFRWTEDNKLSSSSPWKYQVLWQLLCRLRFFLRRKGRTKLLGINTWNVGLHYDILNLQVSLV
jgi:hypothetical protein